VIRSIPWMFLVACHAPEPGARPPRGEPGPTWTVAVWMDGDNDLEAYVPSDLDELERAATDDVHIVVQADRIDGYSRKDGDWTGTRRYEIVADQGEGVVSPVLEDLGERDMGSHEELAEFLAWVAEEHPADHLALVMWNHGGGFWIASDDTDGNKLDLNRGELDLALADHVAEHGKLDVIAFDACNMGQWETAYSLHDEALVFVASQAWVNYGGYAYDEAFPSLSAGATPAELGDALARSTMGNDEKTHAAVDLARMPELHAAIDELAAAYLDAPGGGRRVRRRARGRPRARPPVGRVLARSGRRRRRQRVPRRLRDRRRGRPRARGPRRLDDRPVRRRAPRVGRPGSRSSRTRAASRGSTSTRRASGPTPAGRTCCGPRAPGPDRRVRT
jgi:hypothetical protein